MSGEIEIAIAMQREEILKAFIAKYNVEPNECEQIVEHYPSGKIRWYVRKKAMEVSEDEQAGYQRNDQNDPVP